MNPTGQQEASLTLGESGSCKAADLRKPQAALPLRLTVAKGGVGIELARPVRWGLGVVEALSVGLVGVSYPVDLTPGVKQFRHRRSELLNATVTLDLDLLALKWAQAAGPLWGEKVSVTMAPIFAARTSSPKEAVGDGPASDGPGTPANDEQAVRGLAVRFSSASALLAFDLVICSGPSPGLMVDAARGLGTTPLLQQRPPLRIAADLLNAGLRLADGCDWARQSGRSLAVDHFAQAVALAVFPHLGCRVPAIGKQVIVSVSAQARALAVRLGVGELPFSAGRRSLKLLAQAPLLRGADEALFLGKCREARTAYLHALSEAPTHTELLLASAELDLSCSEEGHRAHSALSFLSAALPLPDGSDRATVSRHRLALASARSLAGQADAAGEAWQEAAVLEPDALLSARIYLLLSQRAKSLSEKAKYLDQALSRAPGDGPARRARFEIRMRSRSWEAAAADAEHLLALTSALCERTQLCREIGGSYRHAQLFDQAAHWLQLALRFSPADPETMVELSYVLVERGENVPAAELLHSALVCFEKQLKKLGEVQDTSASVLLELRQRQAAARLSLARILDELEDSPSALCQLGLIPTSGATGGLARLMEAIIAQRMGRAADKQRALLGLLQAVESGHVPAGPVHAGVLRSLEQRGEGDDELVAFAQRVFAALPEATDVPSPS